MLVPLGLTVVGVGSLHASDMLQGIAPWRHTAPPGFHPTNTLVSDTVEATVPLKAEFRRRVADGDLPLWSPYQAGGAPLSAVPNASTLAPLNLPYLVVPLHAAPAVVKLLELLVAAGGMFLLARRLSLSRPAALVGALAYVHTGFQVVWTNWPQSHVGALIPGLFWAVERGLQRRSPWALWPVPLISAAMWLEGFPAVTLWAHVAAAAYAAVRVWRDGDLPAWERLDPAGAGRPRRRRLTAAGTATAAAMAAGVALAAFQLVPFVLRLTELDLSHRVEKLSTGLPVESLGTLVVPDLLGNPADRVFFGPDNYVEIQAFVGGAVLLLALVAAVAAARRWLRGPGEGRDAPPGAHGYLVGAAAVVGMLLWGADPLIAALNEVPVLGANDIGRSRALLGFALAALAAVGTEALRREALDRTGRWAVLAGFAVVGGVLAVLVADVHSEAELAEAGAYLWRQVRLPVAALVAAAALIAAALWAGRRARAVALVLLPLVIAVEAVAFARPFLPRIPSEQFYPVTAAHEWLLDHLDGQRVATADRALFPGTSALYGYRTVTSLALMPESWADLLRTVDPDVFAATRANPILSPTAAVATSPVLDRMGARYFATAPETPLLGPVAPGPATTGAAEVRAGETVRVEVPPAPLRGVRLPVTGPITAVEPTFLEVTVTDAAGAVLARGERRIHRGDRAGSYDVALLPRAGGTTADAPAGDAPAGDERAWGADAPGPWTVAVTVRSEGDRDRVGIRTAASGRPALDRVLTTDDGLALAFVDGIRIYRRLGALPRVRWAPTARVEPAPRSRVAAASSPADEVPLMLSAEGPSGGGGDAVLEVREDSGDVVEVAVEAATDGYVVVGDAIQGSWVAEVDGAPAPVVDADHAFGAVHVPAGEHVVTFRYDPAGWTAGWIVTLLAAAALLGGAAAARRRRA